MAGPASCLAQRGHTSGAALGVVNGDVQQVRPWEKAGLEHRGEQVSRGAGPEREALSLMGRGWESDRNSVPCGFIAGESPAGSAPAALPTEAPGVRPSASSRCAQHPDGARVLRVSAGGGASGTWKWGPYPGPPLTLFTMQAPARTGARGLSSEAQQGPGTRCAWEAPAAACLPLAPACSLTAALYPQTRPGLKPSGSSLQRPSSLRCSARPRRAR